MGGKPVLRMAKAKAGPVVSDNGNFIIDADFGVIKDPAELNKKLKMLPGVVDTGLFINGTDANIPIAYIGLENGAVKEKLK
jgi:ribose 5-phosphate isomerase A